MVNREGVKEVNGSIFERFSNQHLTKIAACVSQQVQSHPFSDLVCAKGDFANSTFLNVDGRRITVKRLESLVGSLVQCVLELL
jgi:hypothetical protein